MNMLININSPLSYKLNLTGVSPKASEIIGSIFESTFIQDLNKHVELNPYHDHENVLEHVQKVFANLQELMKFEFIKDENLKQKYLEYLKEKITSQNNLSRGELLLIACSLHDISKTTMLKVVDDVGNTKGTGHEHASATLVPEVLRSSELSAIEVS